RIFNGMGGIKDVFGIALADEAQFQAPVIPKLSFWKLNCGCSFRYVNRLKTENLLTFSDLQEVHTIRSIPKKFNKIDFCIVTSILLCFQQGRRVYDGGFCRLYGNS